jgi:hypothetical protein
VGYNDPNARIFLVLVPVGSAFGVMMIYFWKGTYKLLSVSLSSSDFISPEGRAEVKSYAMRVIVFTLCATLIFVAALVLQINSIRQRPVWERSLRESIMYECCSLCIVFETCCKTLNCFHNSPLSPIADVR